MPRTPYNDPEAEKVFTDNDVDTRLAGDVIPLKIAPSPNSGPSPESSSFNYGKRSDPKVVPIGEATVNQWLERMRKKQK